MATLLLLASVWAIAPVAQEIDPVAPANLAAAVRHADLIAIGTFRVGWRYPWFDGWHYRGALRVETILDGRPPAEPAISFQWTEAYGATCLLCERMSALNGQRGIWLLARHDGTWRLANGAAPWCDWPLPMRAQSAVERAIRARSIPAPVVEGGSPGRERTPRLHGSVRTAPARAALSTR